MTSVRPWIHPALDLTWPPVSSAQLSLYNFQKLSLRRSAAFVVFTFSDVLSTLLMSWTLVTFDLCRDLVSTLLNLQKPFLWHTVTFSYFQKHVPTFCDVLLDSECSLVNISSSNPLKWALVPSIASNLPRRFPCLTFSWPALGSTRLLAFRKILSNSRNP